MALLTREEASQSTRKLRMEKVDVTEWGNVDPETGVMEPKWLYVKELSAAEREVIDQSIIIHKRNKQIIDMKGYRVRIVIAVCCDENGTPVFRPGDENWLGQLSTVPFDRIVTVYKKMNYINEDEEELLKN